jgi:hypothetical protein
MEIYAKTRMRLYVLFKYQKRSFTTYCSPHEYNKAQKYIQEKQVIMRTTQVSVMNTCFADRQNMLYPNHLVVNTAQRELITNSLEKSRRGSQWAVKLP